MAGIIDRTLVSWYIQQNLFTLLYGFIRPRISGKVRQEIEEEEEETDDSPSNA